MSVTKKHAFNRFYRCQRCGITAETVHRVGLPVATNCRGRETGNRYDEPVIPAVR